MEKEHFIHFDNIVNATLINIYSLSKNNKKIEIILPTKDLPSLRKCIIEIALMAGSLFSMPVYFDLSIFEYIKLKFFNKKFKKNTLLKRMSRSKMQNSIYSIELMSYVARENEDNISVYQLIYDEYYK